MSLLTMIGSTWLNYLWVQSLNILPLALFIVPFSLMFNRKLPQITFGLWIILILRLLLPAEYGINPMIVSPNLIPTYEPEMVAFLQEVNLKYELDIRSDRSETLWELAIPILTILTVVGTLFKLGYLIYKRRRFSQVSLTPILEGPVHEKLDFWKQRFHIRRRVKLFSGNHPHAPHTSGSLNPRIILHEKSLETGHHLDSIFVHELGHIQRWDDLFILLSQSVMSLFFFHPLMWIAQYYLSESREMSVDQMVVSRKYLSREDYGSTLIDAAVMPSSQHLATTFSTSKNRIKKRILALKGTHLMQARTATLILVLSLPLLGISWIAPNNSIPQAHGISSQFIAPLENIRVTSGFGERMHPLKKKVLNHGGVDLAGKTGTPVMATADGVVVSSKFEKGWGNTIRLVHDEAYSSVYAQLNRILVKPNQTVKQGDIIGHVGSTGNSTGPHLHFELRHKNQRVNPTDYIDF